MGYHVGKDLVVNGKSIFNDVNSAINDYKAKDWYDFGVAIGDASAKTLLGAEELEREMMQANLGNEVEDFVSGLLFELIGKDLEPDIKNCLNNESGLEKEIEQAIADFKK